MRGATSGREARRDQRSGSYDRKLQTKAGEVTLKVPKLRRQTFETAIIERYRRRESSVEEALIEMYLAGVSVRRVEDITEALWGTRVSPGTVSNLNKKIYGQIEAWRTPADRGRAALCVPRRHRAQAHLGGRGAQRLAAGGDLGQRRGLPRRSSASSRAPRRTRPAGAPSWRISRGAACSGVELIVSDACMGLVESAAEFFPEARWQRCMVHFYRNVFSHVPAGKLREVALMLKAIHAQEDLPAAQRKAGEVVARLHSMRLGKAAELVETAVPETLAYYAFPEEHWRRIRTNNPLERIMREIRRRTRVVGAFPDGNSAINLAAARLRHIAGTRWSTKRYLNMELLRQRNAMIA